MIALKLILSLALIFVGAASAQTPESVFYSSTSHQNFTVMMGYTDLPNRAELQAFFPARLRIHVGDAVTWIQNSKDIHTVTFSNSSEAPGFLVPLPGGPEGAMMVNPIVAFPAIPEGREFNGSSYANSGVMGPQDIEPKSFTLKFTRAGIYNYSCVVHEDNHMLGAIVVEEASTPVPTAAQAAIQGREERNALLARVPLAIASVTSEVVPARKNPDGTTTRYITVGYSQGQIDLAAFYPARVSAQPGDTVIWTLSKKDIAPHTVTFLNGAEEPENFVLANLPGGEKAMLFNPEVVTPSRINESLTNRGIYNSGIMDPHASLTRTFFLKVGNVTGDLNYICILHEESGMKGTLVSFPKVGGAR